MSNFQSIVDVYYSNINGFQGTALTIASNLFTILAGIQISMSIILWILNRDDPDSLIINLAKKIFFLSFFWMIIDHYDDWIPVIYKSFTAAGGEIAGNSNISPTNIYDKGVDLYTYIIENSKFEGIFPSISGMIMTLLLGGVIWFCFLRIAMEMVVVMVGGKIILTGGIVLLGFSGSKWTMSFAEKYLTTVMTLGIKMMFLLIMVGLGEVITDDWVNQIANIEKDHMLETFMNIAGASMLYCTLAIKIPDMAASLLTGTFSIGYNMRESATAMQQSAHAMSNVARQIGNTPAIAKGAYQQGSKLSQIIKDTASNSNNNSIMGNYFKNKIGKG